MAAAGGAAKTLRHVVPWPAGRFIVAGENGGVDQHVAINFVTPDFFSTATMLRTSRRALKGGIATKTGDKIAFQFATLNVTSGFKGVVKRKSGPSWSRAARAVITFWVLAGSAIC